MAKYLLENVHAAYPEARCGLLVASRGAMVRDLLAAYPWIEVIESSRRSLPSLCRLWRRFGGSQLVTTSYTKPGGRFSLPSKIAARLLARAGGMVGFDDASPLNRFLYDRLVPSDYALAPRLLEQRVLAAAGVPVLVEDMTLRYLPQPGLLERLSLTRGQYLVLHLFAGSDGRAMSQEKRQALIDAFERTLTSVPIVLTGTKADLPFLRDLRLPPQAKVVAGDLSVQELAALIDQSGCMVSIGTGPSHMAAHLGARLIVLVVCVGIPWCGKEQMGERAADHIFSDTEACASGHAMKAQPPACIEGIAVDDVARAAASYFGKGVR